MVSCLDVKNTFTARGDTKILKGIEAINQGLKVLFLTSRKELFGDPNFGSMLMEKSFNLANTILKDIITDNIYNIVSRYDRRIEIQSINFRYKNHTSAIIDITYTYKNEATVLNLWLSTEDI